MIAKYIVLSNIISVVLDNILRICIPETPLDIKVYSSDPRECLCTS